MPITHERSEPMRYIDRLVSRHEAQFIERAASATDQATCITWPFKIEQQSGYGVVALGESNGKRTSTTAHRVVLELVSGQCPGPDYEAAHAPTVCHNPSCINPHHLRWATRTANRDDHHADGTRFSRLSQADIARMFHVDQSYVSRALAGKANSALAERIRDRAIKLDYLPWDYARGRERPPIMTERDQ